MSAASDLVGTQCLCKSQNTGKPVLRNQGQYNGKNLGKS